MKLNIQPRSWGEFCDIEVEGWESKISTSIFTKKEAKDFIDQLESAVEDLKSMNFKN